MTNSLEFAILPKRTYYVWTSPSFLDTDMGILKPLGGIDVEQTLFRRIQA